MGGDLGGGVRKVKGLRSTGWWWLPKSHGDVKNSVGNIVSNTAITAHGASWVLEIQGHHSVSYIIDRYTAHLKLIWNNVDCQNI